MQRESYLCIGGNRDGEDTIQIPVGVTDKETYRRSTLSVGDVSITVYVHESLTPEQALSRLWSSITRRGV
jgi:hypothetical protein